MAGAATVSPYISLTCTNLRNTISPSRPLSFPPQSLVLRHHFFRTRFNGNSRLISTHRSKGSIGEEELEEIDEAFSYNNDNVIGEEEEESDEDDDTESSLDLLFRFLQSMFKKLSKRVRKVSFAVDGVLLLASLSILKALLEVACTIGGTVFVVILLLRVIWAAMAYFQLSGNNFNPNGTSYGRTQPVT
ncbi:hypothetical protein CsSME_00043755 [Camellia sinensis var. sinensis]